MMSRAVLLAWLACSASAGTVEVYLHDFSDSQCTGTIRHTRNFTLGVCSTDAETGGNTAAKVSYSWMVTCNSDNKIVAVQHFAPGCMGTSDGTDRQSGTYTPNLGGCTNPMWMEGRGSMNATLDAGDCGTTTTSTASDTSTSSASGTVATNDTVTTTGSSGSATSSGSSDWGSYLPNLLAVSFLAMY